MEQELSREDPEGAATHRPDERADEHRAEARERRDDDEPYAHRDVREENRDLEWSLAIAGEIARGKRADAGAHSDHGV